MKFFIFLSMIFCSFSWGYAQDTFTLYSVAFSNNTTIPLINTCKIKGGNISPRINWVHPPKGTKSLALTCIDTDAPGGNFVHWLIYNIPTTSNILYDGVAKTETTEQGARQGINSFNRIGYDGPCPPPGKTHHYIFTLYALDADLQLAPGSQYKEFQEAIKGHVLGEAKLTGLFNTETSSQSAGLSKGR